MTQHVLLLFHCRSYADIIIPWQRGDNLVAIDLITQHISLKLRCHDLLRIYPNLELLPSNFQVGRASLLLTFRACFHVCCVDT